MSSSAAGREDNDKIQRRMNPTKTQLESISRRSPEALTALVDENLPILLAGALAIGLPRADAEEVVQETFVSFLSALDRFEGRSSVRTYLFGILYHKAAHLRAKSRRETGADDIEAVVEARFNANGTWARPPRGPEAQALDGEFRAWVERCAEGLSEDQRAVFFLKEVEGEAPEAICNALGVSATNLRVLLHRAKLKLRECLERNWEKAPR
ncbi:MAG: sigma-70 family RNA polymerase sigma factor [Elusimicrobia bacterium]|nr:sigma-70 family RNA polymerase sigma factor [Elusimicrobiota bacterium]